MDTQLELFADYQVAAPPAVAFDQAALALLPFAVVSTKPRHDPLEIAYQANVDGVVRRVAVTMDPGASTGLPTQADQPVFLGLLQLSLRQSPPQTELLFRRSELYELLGWGTGGSAYQRLEQGLARLTGLTLRLKATARDGRSYTERASGVHIIDAYHIGSGWDSVCRVSWGEIVREGFRLGDFKRMDLRLLRELENPLTLQLYRLLDRVVLSGEPGWRVGWRTLAMALGMSADAYSRAARFKQVLTPHFERLIAEGVVERVDYERGGTFVFHLPNYLRVQLRRVLRELGCYPEAARQLVSGHDELLIMQQIDCHQHGLRRASGVGYLVEAIRQNYELRYADDEPEAFAALLSLFSADEVKQALGLARRLGQTAGGAPQTWPVGVRAVVRFVLGQGLDAERA